MKWKRMVYLVLVLLMVSTTAGAQNREYPGDPRMANYEQWNPTPWNSKVAYINGVIIGAYYVAVAYAYENPGMGLPDIQHLVPEGIAADQLAKLVDAVYGDANNRKLPIVYIVVNWRKLWPRYGGGI